MRYDGPARIVVGYDGSADANRALQYGIVEARERAGELVIVHAVDDTVLNSAWGVVFDPEEIKLGAARMLAATVNDAVAAGMERNRVHTQIVLGNPAAALTKLSAQASLVVLGRRSAEEGEKLFVGSTTTGVVGAARCPVIVVSGSDVIREGRAGVIGVAVDTSARGAVALEWALQECRDHGGRVTVISVCRAPQSRWFSSGTPTEEQKRSVLAVTRERMSELVNEIATQFGDVPVELEVAYGVPLDILVERTDELDLLLVEAHASFPTYSVGGLIRGLLTHARCPIGVIRPTEPHDS